MGREVRRVPLKFDWPLNEPWKGFINPHHKPCPENNKTCFNGETAAGAWLSAIVRLLMCAGGDGLRTIECRERGQAYPHPYLVEFELAPTFGPPEDLKGPDLYVWLTLQNRPGNRADYVLPATPELAQLTAGLAGRSADRLFAMHDACDHWSAVKKIRKAAGMKKGWGVCPVCKGECIDPAVKAKYNRWRPKSPPKGKGWQLWETVSEGSPITPVFPTAEGLIDHMCQPATGEDRRMPWDHGWSREVATKFVMECGWAPSMIGGPGGTVDGVTGIVQTAMEKDRDQAEAQNEEQP